MNPISILDAQEIDLSKQKMMKVSEASQEFFDRFVEGSMKMLEGKYAEFPDTENHPAYQDFAKVTVNGKVVATLDNNGFISSSNAYAGRIQDAIKNLDGKGPQLAGARAEAVAKALGGQIEMADTALSQLEYSSLKMPEVTVNKEAMLADDMYVSLLKLQEERVKLTTLHL